MPSASCCERAFTSRAFALVRLQFEAVVRAIWILECAKADWLERFVTPMADGQLEEPVLGPPVPAMLSAIATKAPVIAGMLSQLKEGAWEPMHSYVHGGVRPIAHSLAGTTHYQVSAVLRNANGLGLLAVNAMTIAFQDPRLGGFVARLSARVRRLLAAAEAVVSLSEPESSLLEFRGASCTTAHGRAVAERPGESYP